MERHARGDLADAPAVRDPGGEWTFAELSDEAARAAGALRAAGARRGDRVVVAQRDGIGWIRAFLGAARLGAVPVPVDPLGDPATLAAVIDDCEPAVVVAEEPPADPMGATVVPAAELAAGVAVPVVAVHPEDLAYLVYSSGSTGRPKGAMHAHRDMRAGIETYAREVLALGPGDRCHSVARLFTSLGFGNGFFRVLGSGATAVLSGVLPTPRAVLDTVARERVTVLTGVPTFWSQLARFLERHPDPEALAGVRVAVSSGDSLPPPVAARLRAASGLELVEGLGCSECSNIVISTRPGEPLPGTLGRVVAGVEVRLADDEGRPVPAGQPGRLWIRSESNTTGYWRRAEATRELVMGPWLRMGDVLSEEGGVYRHLGRADDLFKVDARWVSPTAGGGRPARRTRRSPRRRWWAGPRTRASCASSGVRRPRAGRRPRGISPRRCAGTWPAPWPPTPPRRRSRWWRPSRGSRRESSTGGPCGTGEAAREPQHPQLPAGRHLVEQEVPHEEVAHLAVTLVERGAASGRTSIAHLAPRLPWVS